MLSARPVHYEIGGHPDVMNYGGIAVAHRLVTKLGLPEQIDQRLHLLKVHLPYHMNLSSARPGLHPGLGHRPRSPTRDRGGLRRRFEASDVVELMEAINAVRPKLWQGRGRDLLGPVAYLDVDGVLAPTGGERKAGMEISYKGIWGSLVVSLANTKEVLYVVNRPGNVPSHTDAARWLIALLTPHAPRVCLRGDTDFSRPPTDRWASRWTSCSAWATRPCAVAPDEAASIWPTRDPASQKQRIVEERGFLDVRLNYEDVAEFDYQPRACARPYRVGAAQEPQPEERRAHPARRIRYFFYITTRS